MSSQSLRAAVALLSPRHRATAVALGAATAAEHALIVVAALLAIDGNGFQLVICAAIVVVLHGLRAFLRGILRAAVQRRIHEAAAVALLRAAPLGPAVVDADAELVLGEGVHNGSLLLSDRVPTLAGEAAASLVIACFLVATQPPRLLLLGALGLAFAMITGVAVRRLTARSQDEAWALYRPVLERTLFVLRGRLEIVANGADRSFLRTFDELLGAFERGTLRADRLSGIAARVPLFAGAAGVVIALAIQGDGRLGVSKSTLSDLAILASVLPAFVGLAQNSHETFRLALAFEPTAALLSLPPAALGGTEPAPESPTTIAVQELTYRYVGAGTDALSGLSLSFTLGAPLILSGPNGSGKSTLIHLLAGLDSPTRGLIAVDGRDLADVDIGAWRERVTFLPQQPYMADGMTVSEAIRLLVPSASADAIRKALTRVGILEVLASRADDPTTVKVGQLSVGQRKRVAIARAILRDAPVILLDEPDANLDADGVEMVANLAQELAKTRLVAIAAHTDRVVLSSGVHVKLAA